MSMIPTPTAKGFAVPAVLVAVTVTTMTFLMTTTATAENKMNLRTKLFGDMTTKEIMGEVLGGLGLLAFIAGMILIYIAM